MNRAIKSAISATPYLVFLVIVPLILPRYIPSELARALDQAGVISLQGIVSTFIVIGITLAVLSVLKNMSKESSPLKPIASSLGTIVTLYLILYLVGLGNPSVFGLTNIGVQGGGVGSTLLLDLRFILLLIMLAAALRIIHTSLKFREARRQHLQVPTLPHT